MVNFKYRFDRGQHENLRSNDTIKRLRVKVDESVERYRTARKALTRLGPILRKTGWASTLPILQNEDVRQMSVGLEGDSEGNRSISWIWTSQGIGGDRDMANDGVQEGMFFSPGFATSSFYLTFPPQSSELNGVKLGRGE